MKNKDTNTDYQGDQKWEIVEITIFTGIHFFFLLEIRIHYFLYRELSIPTRKKINPT